MPHRLRPDDVGNVTGNVTDRVEAEAQAVRARERLLVLTHASASIGTTLDPYRTAEELVQAMVPAVARAGGVHVLERLLQPGYDAAADSRHDAQHGFLMRRLAFTSSHDDFPYTELPVDHVYRLDPDSAPGTVLRKGHSVTVLPNQMPRAMTASGNPYTVFCKNPAEPLRVVPLTSRGHILGFAVYEREPDAVGEYDETLGDELVARVATAIDNALLFRRERETADARHAALRELASATRRLEVLHDAKARIGTSLDMKRTAEELVSVALSDFADYATVDMIASVLRLDDPVPLDAQDRVPLRLIAAGEAFPLGLAELAWTIGDNLYDGSTTYTGHLRTGEPLFVPQVRAEDIRRVSAAPELTLGPALEAGIASYLMVPLVARGMVLGGAAFVRLRDRAPFTAVDVALASDIAAHAALSIDNARLYAREKSVALTLQRSLLPSRIPAIPGLEVAHRYVPGSSVNEVGGDWFDVVPLPDRKVALIVGDVMGHGIHAAAAMGQLRTAARGFATVGLPPDQVLGYLDATLQGLGEDRMATCVCAIYDPATRKGSLARAGHPPPVITSAYGTTTLVGCPPGPPLGIGGMPFAASPFELPVGSAVTLYTDGLIDRREYDVDEGIARLRRALGGCGRTPEELCDLVLADLTPEGTGDDDIAMIVARAVPLS